MTVNESFNKMFNPQSIAIVGVSRSNKMSVPGNTGLSYLHTLQWSNFKGRIYPVNPRASEIEGFKAYPSIRSIPEVPDLVSVMVPAAAVPQVLEECVAAGVRNIVISSSGFSETGLPEGRELDRAVRDIALKGGLRIVGPNCMGFHVPSSNMKMFADMPLIRGSVAFISQSGSHSHDWMAECVNHRLGFSKVISYGNALLIDAPDFLEYLGNDAETRIICMYIEGIKDGRRLIDIVRQLNLKKPVIIWKGGLSVSGARAAYSHTGSMAGDRVIWDAFFRQTGAICAGSIEEIVEVSSALINIQVPPGKRVAVLGAGGGDSVANGDICSAEGLEVPHLSPQTMAGLTEHISLINAGLKNPLDAPGIVFDVSRLGWGLRLLAADPAIDVIILSLRPEILIGPLSSYVAGFKECILRFINDNQYRKPIVISLPDKSRAGDAEKAIKELREAGITAYGSLHSACRAIKRTADYHQFVAATGTRANI